MQANELTAVRALMAADGLLNTRDDLTDSEKAVAHAVLTTLAETIASRAVAPELHRRVALSLSPVLKYAEQLQPSAVAGKLIDVI